jgi:hypothetical protein
MLELEVPPLKVPLHELLLEIDSSQSQACCRHPLHAGADLHSRRLWPRVRDVWIQVRIECEQVGITIISLCESIGHEYVGECATN